MEKIMSDKDNALHNTLFHFWQSARSWSIHAYLKIIEICKASNLLDSRKIGIAHALELVRKRNELLKKNTIAFYNSPKWKLTKLDLASVYMDLSLLYEADWQQEKTIEWKNKATTSGVGSIIQPGP